MKAEVPSVLGCAGDPDLNSPKDPEVQSPPLQTRPWSSGPFVSVAQSEVSGNISKREQKPSLMDFPAGEPAVRLGVVGVRVSRVTRVGPRDQGPPGASPDPSSSCVHHGRRAQNEKCISNFCRTQLQLRVLESVPCSEKKIRRLPNPEQKLLGGIEFSPRLRHFNFVLSGVCLTTNKPLRLPISCSPLPPRNSVGWVTLGASERSPCTGQLVDATSHCTRLTLRSRGRQYGRLANTSGPFLTCPNCQISDIDTIWSLAIGSGSKFRVNVVIWSSTGHVKI